MSDPIQGKYLGTAGVDEPEGDSLFEAGREYGPGAYWWSLQRQALWVYVPDSRREGCSPVRLPVNGGGKPFWDWDGNIEKPTLNPSVHVHAAWHGWIRAGTLVTA